VVWRSFCRSLMLRQEELAFIKALSTFQVSPAVLKELRKTLSRKKKRPAVPAGSPSTTPRGWAGAPQRPSSKLAGNRQAKELASQRAHQQSRANKLIRTAGNAVRPRLG
jgi:hypothetical protein